MVCCSSASSSIAWLLLQSYVRTKAAALNIKILRASYDDTKSYTGFLEVTGTTELNGGILAVDPDYSQHAAMASLNKLSHGAASLPDLQAGSLDGHLYVGQNAALGIGSDSLATLQAKVAKFQNANGAFNPTVVKLFWTKFFQQRSQRLELS